MSWYPAFVTPIGLMNSRPATSLERRVVFASCGKETLRSVRPRYLPIPYQDSPEAGRLILRDGTTATIRVAQPQDQEAMAKFFASLSDESRVRRFFGFAAPSNKLIESFCDPSNPRAQLSLVVLRGFEDGPGIIATGSYVARDEATAEVAMAVDDHFHGRGIGSLLLERLALLAVANGFIRFWAITDAQNKLMLDVFRNSGFECRTKMAGQYVEVDLSVMPSETSVTRSELRDRISTTASLRPFFQPRSVAVIGASRNPSNIGARILNALISHGFQGRIYPINPRAGSVASIVAYPTVRDLPEAPDLGIIAVPRDAVLDVVDDCAARGTKAVVVITAGFAETGPEGQELQRRLVDKIRAHGMRMVGPNCLGLINPDPAIRLNASFSPLFPDPGRIAFSSQSGALGLAVLSLARERELGISNFVSVGNKADVSGNDLLQYWEEDKQTEVILLYLESFGNPRRFARVAKRVSRHKPIVAVKAGRTGAGRRAAGSHTAALAASDVAVEALFHQTGVIRADTLDEMFDLAAALSTQPLPKGRRVAILTNAGGLGILCADTCEASGLTVQELSASTKNLLKRFLPPTASVMNPVDMIASAGAEHFRRAVEILLAADEVDAIIVLYIDLAVANVSDLARGVATGVAAGRARGGEKPVLACVMAGSDSGKPIFVDAERVPTYAFPESAARVLGKITAYAEWRKQPEALIPDFEDIQPRSARAICQHVLHEQGVGWLSAEAVRKVLSALALPLPRGGVCRTGDEAARLAREIGFPVAVKLVSRRIIHKSEVGGVKLNLQSETAVRQAFADIQARLVQEKKLDAMDGVLVQPMIPAGVELMVGVTEDPLFGPLIAFGLGGIHVEILRDVCFRVTPLTDRDAREMVRSIRGYRLLEGYRGHPPADIPAIEELLLRISRLVEEVPEICELDLNPIIALPPGEGCVIVDARIRVER
ncbi:MAG TPA: GNAT family N-acetyltransferase [Candidatus Binatia bacterium]|nr:GNAT family N-acetyltransferase [Candidatus Binatia bacterium]